MAASILRLCPECGNKVVRAGKVTVNRSGRKKQQWKCGSCGRRTLSPVTWVPLQESADVPA